MNNEIIVMGNSRAWGGDLVIGHAEMKDAIDGAAVRQALRDVGCCENDLPTVDELGRVVNVFAKAEASRR
jgi:cyanuric acid amidohydrolase